MVEQVKFPLHDAAKRCDLSAVERLLAEGADPNILDDQRMSPLVWAVYGGYVEIVEALLAGGADVNFRVNTGETPLLASAHGPVRQPNSRLHRARRNTSSSVIQRACAAPVNLVVGRLLDLSADSTE